MSSIKTVRDGYGDALVKAGKTNQDLVVLSADLTDSTRVKNFKENYPNRFIEVGVAEQNMIGIAAGLALSGKTVVTNSYAVFSPGRTWDQIRVCLGYQNTNVKIAGHHSGISIGKDGATHQGIEDMAILRPIPNLTILAPADYHQAKKATLAALEHQGPVYLRLTKSPAVEITSPNDDFKIGQAQVLVKGTDVTLVGSGPVLSEALKAAEILKTQKISLEIINSHSIKPLDTKTILNSVQKTHCLVTLEDHQVAGGLGSAILEALAQTYAAPVTEMLGIKDRFGQSGTTEELWKEYGLNSNFIVKAVEKVLARKKKL